MNQYALIKSFSLILAFCLWSHQSVADLSFRIINKLPPSCGNPVSIKLFFPNGPLRGIPVKTGVTTPLYYAKQNAQGWPYIGIQENVKIDCSKDILQAFPDYPQCNPNKADKTGRDNACLNFSVDNKTCQVTNQNCQFPPFPLGKDFSLDGSYRYEAIGKKNGNACDITIQRKAVIPKKQQEYCP